MVAHAFNLSNWEVEARGSGLQSHPGLHCEILYDNYKLNISVYYVDKSLGQRKRYTVASAALKAKGNSKCRPKLFEG